MPAEPQTIIFTCDAQELIAVNSCAGCIVGAVVALFYITNTVSTHSSVFPRILNKGEEKFFLLCGSGVAVVFKVLSQRQLW